MVILHGVHHPALVVLSICIAILSSFTALSLARKIFASEKTVKKYWLLSGSIAMGAGIWSMHSIGMLAFSLPVTIVYDAWFTLLSLLIAIMASGFALTVTTRKDPGLSGLLLSSLLMGSGIASMHYVGMMAMISVAQMHYQPALVVTSIVVAFMVSLIALKLTFYFRTDQDRFFKLAKTGSGLVMGLGIAAVHYIGMTAVTFTADDTQIHAVQQPIASAITLDPAWLSVAIASMVLLILGSMFFVLFVDSSVTRRLLNSERFLAKNLLIVCASIYGVVYWLLEVAFHAYAIGHGTLLQELLNFDPNEIWMRIVVIITALGFGIFAQRLLWLARSMTQELAVARDNLVATVAERTTELSESEQRVRSVLNTAYDAFTAINSKGRIIDWNMAAERMFGWRRDEVIGRSIDEALFPEASKPITQLITQSGLLDYQPTFECIAIHKNHTEFSIEGGLSVLQLGDGAVFNIFMRDITQRKQDELALEQAKELAEQANSMKSEFLANMSHELRTPLNAIMGFSEVLKDKLVGELNPDQADYIGEIFDSSAHLLSLINDILDLSKVEAGKMELELEAVNLPNLLKNSLSIIRERANSHQIKLVSAIDESIVQALVDERKLKQMVFNLLSNAVKFTPDGGTVTLSAQLQDECLCISVSDTGIGISTEDQQKLFQPFVQVDGSITRQQQGTGLGLALVKSLTQLHGGRVSLVSELRKGSRFTLHLPYRPGAVVEAETTSTLMCLNEDTTGHSTILIIEDDEQAATLMMAQLKHRGYRTLWACNAQQGMAFAHDLLPDLVLLDILLPDLDGWSVLSEIKSSPATAHIPVMVVSIVADAQKGITLGAVDVMEKPIRREQLLATIRRVLNDVDGHILIIDDDPKARELLERYLQPEGIKTRTAENGRQGLQMIAANRPVMVILDLMMPEMSGFEVLATLRSSADSVDLPVLVLSSKILTKHEMSYLMQHNVSLVHQKGRALSDIFTQIRQIINP